MDFKHTNLPIKNELPKLVRDNILELIHKNDNVEPIFHIAESDSEFDFFMKKKIVEEAEEVKEAENKEELTKEMADILEIIDALKAFHGISDDELLSVKKLKKDKNGGFSKRHIFEGKK